VLLKQSDISMHFNISLGGSWTSHLRSFQVDYGDVSEQSWCKLVCEICLVL